MPEFKFFRDQKITIWERDHFSITAPDEEAAEQNLREIEKEGFDRDSGKINHSHSEFLFDSADNLTVEENGGCPTVEYYTPNGNMIFDNSEESQPAIIET